MMRKREKHFLDHLAEKTENNEISETEDRLLDGFLKHEYAAAEWDSAQMGSRANVSAAIYKKIKKPAGSHIKASNYYKYAAAAVLAIIIGLGTLLLPHSPTTKELTVSTGAQLDSIKLQDGSLVYLAANSSFTYPEHFEGKIRAVSLLKGNAFFKVAKDKKHPFIITSAQVKTKVLGTSFHISLENEKVSVTVSSGHVCVYTKNQVTFLKPNENAVYAGSKLIKQTVSDMALYNWYKKDVELSNVTLDQVFTVLNFKYGTSFMPGDQQMLSTRMTLYIKDGLPLQKILDQINYITHLKFKPYGNQIAVIH